MKERQIEVGVKYRGYGYLNAFGQWCFTPEDKGANAGKRSLVKEGNGYTVSSTKKKVIVHLSFDRGDKKAMIRQCFTKLNELVEIFRTYEF